MDTLFEKPIKSVADGKFICRNCYAIFGSLNELNNHIIPEHTLFYKPPIERMEENKYICQSCYNISSSKEELMVILWLYIVKPSILVNIVVLKL